MKDDFTKIEDVLKESVFKSKAYRQALDKCTLFCFWKNVAGKKFEKLSMPYELKGTKLFVSVANSVVAQELNFFKADLINNYKPYAKGLNFEINDIFFNYKNWGAMNYDGNSSAFDKDFYEDFTEADFNSVILNDEEKTQFDRLKNQIDSLEFLPDDTKEKFFNNILKQHKAQKIRKMS